MLRRHLIADRKWSPQHDGIDYDKWDKEKQDNYYCFVKTTGPDAGKDNEKCNFDAPPLLPGADKVYLELGQLTPRQYSQQLAINEDDGRFSSRWIEFVFRYGVKGFKGFETEIRPNEWEELEFKTYKTSSGMKMTNENFEGLSVFLTGYMLTVAVSIWRRSQAIYSDSRSSQI